MHSASVALGTPILSRCGSPSSAMLKVARRNGRTCRIVGSATLNDLEDATTDGPVLVYCRQQNGGRYVIVRGISDDIVNMSDPVTGAESTMALGEFVSSWYGKGALTRTGWMMAIQ
jgi:hypothetical protein